MSQTGVGGTRAPNAKMPVNPNKLGFRGLAAAGVVAAGFAGFYYSFLRHDDQKKAHGQLETWEAAHHPNGGKTPKYRPEDQRIEYPKNSSQEARVISNYDKDNS
ncbi:hypothetical protein VNI00_009287 [Paramarasmius palmivorus]|uniref:Uncharacterized protein n=1 Tax=Paramarasmius palmivorus TaxID=297713 RepID=A0AAW0CSL0_9AGAR